MCRHFYVMKTRRNPTVPVPHRLARSLVEAQDDSLIAATAQRGGAIYISLFDRLCDQTSCLATDGPGWKDVVTADISHLTEHGSIRAAQSIWASILYSGEGDLESGVSSLSSNLGHN